VKMSETITGSAIRHLASIQFDVTSRLDNSNEDDGAKSLIFYLISHLVDLHEYTATVFQKIINAICNYFQYIQITKN